MNLKKKKVLFLLQLPPPMYGAAVVGKEIYESKKINDFFDASYLNIVLTKNLEHPESAWYRLLHYLWIYCKLLLILCTHHFDLCYLAITCHGSAFLKDSLFVLTCKLFCRKIVIHQHNKGMSADAHKPIYRTLFPLVYKNVKVILLSEHLYEDISAHVRREQILVCPNGSPMLIDPQHTDFQKDSPPHIVFLSNLFLDKGIMTFLDCCEILKKSGIAFAGDIIGAETPECSKEKLLQEIHKRSLEKELTYHGRLCGEDRNQFLRQGTYFLFPTKNETFGLVLLEATQFRMLCLSSPIGGIKDIIRDNETGFLSDPDDAAQYAKHIMNMEQMPTQRDRITQNAFEQYLNCYTLERFEENMLKCLKKSLE